MAGLPQVCCSNPLLMVSGAVPAVSPFKLTQDYRGISRGLYAWLIYTVWPMKAGNASSAQAQDTHAA